MQRICSLLLFLFTLGVALKAQPTTFGTALVDGSYASYNLADRGAFRQVRLQAASSAGALSRNWNFAQGTAPNQNFFNNWRPYSGACNGGLNLVISGFNQVIAPDTGNPVLSASATFNSNSGGCDGFLPPITAGNYYTVNVTENTGDNYMAVLETSYKPDTVTTVSGPSCATNCGYEVTVILSNAPAAGEYAYVRYSTDGFTTSGLVELNFSGITGTATIPDQGSNTVTYYVYTSTNTLAQIISAVSNYGQVAHDLLTLKLGNNNGSNYSYGPCTTSNPVAVCQNTTVTLDMNGNASIAAADIDGGSTDNCGVPALSPSQTSFSCSDVITSKPTDLFFSEYVEGTSNNKYLEIYNGTGIAQILANYQVRTYSNGSATPSTTTTLSGILNPGEVIVLRNASATIYPGTATVAGAVNFNGNDAVELYNIGLGTTADLIGRIGEDPGSQWLAGGNSTQDQTLRRKSTVTGGVTANPASGFPTLATEWDALGTNVISNLGTHGIGSTVTLTATGDGGVQTSCLAVVTVVDNTPPEVSCQDITVQLPADGSFELSTAFILAEVPTSFTDNCQTSNNIGVGAPGLVAYTCSEIGTFPATFGFKDLAGNNTDCTINVTVVDNLAPTAACKAASVQLNASGMASIAPADVFDATNSSDNCGAVNPQSVSPASFTCADLGSNMVTLTVNDGHGNTATCMATVTVADDVYSCNQAPTAACQPVTVDANPNCQGAAAPTDFDGGSTDPEMGILSFGVSPAGPYPLGVTNVTLTVTDPSGASDDCTTTITVVDNSAPSISCPGDFAINANAQCQGVVPNFTGGPIVLANSVTEFSGTQGSGGWLYGQYFAFDAGNFSQLPVYNNNLSQWQDNQAFNTPFLDAYGGHPGVDDFKWAVRRWVSPYSGTVDISLAFYDRDGNCGDGAHVRVLLNGSQIWEYLNIPNSLVTQSLSQAITAGDVLDFVIDPKFDAGCDNTQFTALITVPNGLITSDNCGQVTVDQNPAPGTPVAPGTTIVTLTATDGNSNSMSCDFNLVVSELIPPVAACKPATVQLDANGTGSIAPADVFDATNSSDNCGTATPQSVSPASFSCGDIGPNTVTLTVNDGNGNTATCTATVTVEDNRAPNPACRPATVQLNANGTGSIALTDVFDAINSSDNCGTVTPQSVSPSSFSCGDIGPNTATLTVNDGNGNTATCMATVTVEDNVAPAAACQNTTVQLSTTGTGSIMPNDVFDATNSSDNCGMVNPQSVSPASFSCGNVGPNTVTLTVNDGNGNSATCTATVTVEDPSGFCSQVVCLDAEIDNLVNYIEGLGLASGLERAITRRLETAAIRFCRDYPASIVINGLNSVIDYVDYQSGGSIPTAEADYIITEVQSLIGAINAGIAECCSGEGRPIPGNSFTLEDDATGLEVAPNPFSNETVIRFFLPGTGPATLEVFNMQGQRVTVLCAETLDRGYHTLHWDGTAFNGEVLGSGIYLVRLRNGKMALTRKVSLVR